MQVSFQFYVNNVTSHAAAHGKLSIRDVPDDIAHKRSLPLLTLTVGAAF